MGHLHRVGTPFPLLLYKGKDHKGIVHTPHYPDPLEIPTSLESKALKAKEQNK